MVVVEDGADGNNDGGSGGALVGPGSGRGDGNFDQDGMLVMQIDPVVVVMVLMLVVPILANM